MVDSGRGDAGYGIASMKVDWRGFSGLYGVHAFFDAYFGSVHCNTVRDGWHVVQAGA